MEKKTETENWKTEKDTYKYSSGRGVHMKINSWN